MDIYNGIWWYGRVPTTNQVEGSVATRELGEWKHEQVAFSFPLPSLSRTNSTKRANIHSIQGRKNEAWKLSPDARATTTSPANSLFSFSFFSPSPFFPTSGVALRGVSIQGHEFYEPCRYAVHDRTDAPRFQPSAPPSFLLMSKQRCWRQRLLVPDHQSALPFPFQQLQVAAKRVANTIQAVAQHPALASRLFFLPPVLFVRMQTALQKGCIPYHASLPHSASPWVFSVPLPPFTFFSLPPGRWSQPDIT